MCRRVGGAELRGLHVHVELDLTPPAVSLSGDIGGGGGVQWSPAEEISHQTRQSTYPQMCSILCTLPGSNIDSVLHSVLC